jgi:hypothetical protein
MEVKTRKKQTVQNTNYNKNGNKFNKNNKK